MIDEKNFQKIALLARLKLSSEEKSHLNGQINHILDWIEQLRAVDTQGVNPIATLNLDAMLRRADQISLLATQEEILKNAPESAYGMFVVPKVVE